jgi:Fe-S-cluster containining protein
MSKNPENLCIESGCRGGCCQNMVMRQVSSSNLRLFTGNGVQRVEEISSKSVRAYIRLRDRMRRSPRDTDSDHHGVYYAKETARRSSLFTLVLLGPCPNLAQDGSCNIYPSRPEQCRDFKFGGENCNDIRKIEGLPIITTTIRRRPGL